MRKETCCCDACGKACDRLKKEVEICTECGDFACKDHCVVSDDGLPYCLECGRKEAERLSKADAPGLWPEWARKCLPAD